VPETFIVDKAGRIAYKHIGPIGMVGMMYMMQYPGII